MGTPDSVGELGFLPARDIHQAPYLGKRKQLKQYLDLLDKNQAVTAVALYADNEESLWADFRSCFQVIEAAGGYVTNPKDELLVFYFHQEPQRTLAIFGPAARTRYGADVLRSVVDAAVTEAGRVSGGTEQLERFCYKMSVRLHWLARTAPVRGGAETALPSGVMSSGSLKTAAWAALLGAGLMAAGSVLRTWYCRRRTGATQPSVAVPIFLAEGGFKPRFGAPHSGGFCSMITFAKTPPPPVGGS